MDYAPLLLALGHDCRDCHWNPLSRERGSGGVARRVLMTSMLLLHTLKPGEFHKDEYYRSLAVALLMWTRWYDSVPGCKRLAKRCSHASVLNWKPILRCTMWMHAWTSS